METRRWTNPTQPQTLQIAVFLLYIEAVFGVLFGQVFAFFIVAIAAAEAAVGLAIVIAYFRLKKSVETDQAHQLEH